jgi:hypothetical protein
MRRWLKWSLPVAFCVAGLAVSRATGSMDRVQDCFDVFNHATNCFITLHDEKYGEGCRMLHDDEVPPCSDINWRICNAWATPPPWSSERDNGP